MKRITQVVAILLFACTLTLAMKANADIPLEVRETEGISRVNEMIHNGIPVSRAENITSTDALIIEDSHGSQIPAAFEVLSRWAGGKDDTSQPIQWLLVTFPASISAYGSADFFLKTGTPVAKTNQLTLADTATTYTINTGVAEFVINKNTLTLFDSVSNGSDVLLSGNGGSHSTSNGQLEATADAPVTSVIERQNDHYLVIKVEGDYASQTIGDALNGAPISYKIRYEFFAGSPTVIVSHKFYWAGSGTNSSNGRPSEDFYFTMDNVSLTLPDMTGYASSDVYATAYLPDWQYTPVGLHCSKKKNFVC